MEKFMIVEESLPKAYHAALLELNNYGEEVGCSDYNTKCKEIDATIVITDPLAEPMISKVSPYDPYQLEKYRQEMLDGILDFEVERGKWHYTYHQRYAPQLPFIIRDLKRNPDSRRAIMVIRDPSKDMDDPNPACLQTIQCFIRNGKLEMTVLFRSNDAYNASFGNMFALIMLQKRIADELGVDVGRYTHNANSYHVYERDWEALNNACKRITKSRDIEDITYNYIGFYDELMEEEKPRIAAIVEELKNR